MAEVPMGNDIPSNSKRQQAAVAQSQNKKPDVPIFQGETKQARRKNGGFWKWMKKMFLSDRNPKDIVKEVVEYNIVPGIKDNFYNGLTSAISGFIYQGGVPAGKAGVQNGVNYNRIYSGNTRSTPPPQHTQTTNKDEEINKGFGNPCFKSRSTRRYSDGRVEQGAEEFLNLMKTYDYPTLSVHTMYLMQRKRIDYTWDAYGWTREEILSLGPDCIQRTGDPEWPWMIALPEAHVIS